MNVTLHKIGTPKAIILTEEGRNDICAEFWRQWTLNCGLVTWFVTFLNQCKKRHRRIPRDFALSVWTTCVIPSGISDSTQSSSGMHSSLVYSYWYRSSWLLWSFYLAIMLGTLELIARRLTCFPAHHLQTNLRCAQGIYLINDKSVTQKKLEDRANCCITLFNEQSAVLMHFTSATTPIGILLIFWITSTDPIVNWRFKNSTTVFQFTQGACVTF